MDRNVAFGKRFNCERKVELHEELIEFAISSLGKSEADLTDLDM